MLAVSTALSAIKELIIASAAIFVVVTAFVAILFVVTALSAIFASTTELEAKSAATIVPSTMSADSIVKLPDMLASATFTSEGNVPAAILPTAIESVASLPAIEAEDTLAISSAATG